MQSKVINPYAFAGIKHKEVLDLIGTNLPTDPTFDQLNEVLITSIYNNGNPNLLQDTIAQIYLIPLLPKVYNGYVNNGVGSNVTYHENQQLIINQMLAGLSRVPVESISDFLDDMEETIATSKLSYEEQVPLFIATASGKADIEYWGYQIENPGVWSTYMIPDKALAIMHLPYMASAAIQGALLAYGLSKHPQLEALDIFSSFSGSVGLAAGKVVFGWIALNHLKGT
ncbi:MAG: hypothetical protein V4615_06035 [Bacteroidota bacterium]